MLRNGVKSFLKQQFYFYTIFVQAGVLESECNDRQTCPPGTKSFLKQQFYFHTRVVQGVLESECNAYRQTCPLGTKQDRIVLVVQILSMAVFT